MKSTAEAIKNSNIPATLIRAVVRAIGDRDTLRDVAEHGADAGYSGFTYYSDTVAFFKRHRADIVALVQSMADDLGENPAEMVARFQCLAGRELAREHTQSGWSEDRTRAKNRAILQEYLPSVSRCLYGGRLTDDDTTTANALAWFALEEVARAMVED